MSGKLLLYIFSMALVTYLLRVLPLVLLRRKIESPFLNSLFTYLPYTILGAMTIPAIFYATGHIASAAVGFGAALLVSLKKDSLLITAIAACLAAYLAELALTLF